MTSVVLCLESRDDFFVLLCVQSAWSAILNSAVLRMRGSWNGGGTAHARQVVPVVFQETLGVGVWRCGIVEDRRAGYLRSNVSARCTASVESSVKAVGGDPGRGDANPLIRALCPNPPRSRRR